jgi:hypothetical protein
MASTDDVTTWVVMGGSAVVLVGLLISRRRAAAKGGEQATEPEASEKPKQPMSLGARVLVWVFIAAVGALAFWAATNGVDVRMAVPR